MVLRRVSACFLCRFSLWVVLHIRVVDRFSSMQVFRKYNCSLTLNFISDVSIYDLRMRFAWSAFEHEVEISLIAFCDSGDKLGLGITIVIAWRSKLSTRFLQSFQATTGTCSLIKLFTLTNLEKTKIDSYTNWILLH